MKTIWLTIYLLTGDRIIEPVTHQECEAVMYAARAVQTVGGHLETDHEGSRHAIGRMSCGDNDIVIALPASAGDCEAGA